VLDGHKKRLEESTSRGLPSTVWVNGLWINDALDLKPGVLHVHIWNSIIVSGSVLNIAWLLFMPQKFTNSRNKSPSCSLVAGLSDP
jgi:hypothetical protein